MRRLDETKLQVLAESMATRVVDGYSTQWLLDSSKAPEFLAMIRSYIFKSAYKSDKYDPEDAYGDVICGVWQAFQRYGPKPGGQSFINLIRLKTNNILTNRARKRFSWRSKINYTSVSLDALSEKNCV